jgi:hypothetical protein
MALGDLESGMNTLKLYGIGIWSLIAITGAGFAAMAYGIVPFFNLVAWIGQRL